MSLVTLSPLAISRSDEETAILALMSERKGLADKIRWNQDQIQLLARPHLDEIRTAQSRITAITASLCMFQLSIRGNK